LFDQFVFRLHCGKGRCQLIGFPVDFLGVQSGLKSEYNGDRDEHNETSRKTRIVHDRFILTVLLEIQTDALPSDVADESAAWIADGYHSIV
jgi:hypothetical protein